MRKEPPSKVVETERRNLTLFFYITIHKIFPKKPSLFTHKAALTVLSLGRHLASGTSIYITHSCMVVALEVLNSFCCQFSKVAFLMSLCASGALDILRQGRRITEKGLLSLLFTLIFTYLPRFVTCLSDKSEDLMILGP